ncbi:hypothetical protein OB236_14550 [Paenibacillus sp. WQ 127069]|uniref:Uncharacterized protein n=1 Tax=Paenibacillus baimaensis TaxID=2982185 RepID=A0ABT2UH13_9BACL|nr:hypothetical protein [Paenibacillus sp. WQ 127069]MCU6793331.1 hypothetical protein [Paenibacillus sp. WQ 127069]
MKEFIFESEIHNVKNNTIKGYLEEVISSYNMGNYRSAIVSLYNVVLCDLVFKLKTLHEVYEDQKAQNILELLGNSNNEHRYSAWENKLVNAVVGSTNLLDKQEETLIIRLKEDRDHCAHLALKDYSLYSPNKDQTRAHIRNMFELVFLRDPLLHKDVIDTVLTDIEDYYLTVGSINPERFGSYLSVKYYSKLNKKLEEKLFKALWKYIFISQDKEDDTKRTARYYAICSLVERHPDTFLTYVKNDPVSYCGNIKINKGEAFDTSYFFKLDDDRNKLRCINIKFGLSPQALLIYFLSTYPNFYDELKGDIAEILAHEAEKNINLFTRAIFLNKNLESHLRSIEDYKNKAAGEIRKIDYFDFSVFTMIDTSIDFEQIVFLSKEAENRNYTSVLVDFILVWLNRIGSHDSVQGVMKNMIFPLFHLFSKSDIVKLLGIMNNHGQITGDKKNRHFYIPELKRKISEYYGADFPIDEYNSVWQA